jgi:hypothetical protein
MPFKDLFVRISTWIAPARDLDTPVVEEVLTRNAGSLMRLRGVMSVGVGRTSDGRPAIFLGIDNPQAASVGDLPSSVEGVPVVHRQLGRPEARDTRPEIARAEDIARKVARRDYSERFAETFPDAAPAGDVDVEPVERIDDAAAADAIDDLEEPVAPE